MSDSNKKKEQPILGSYPNEILETHEGWGDPGYFDRQGMELFLSTLDFDAPIEDCEVYEKLDTQDCDNGVLYAPMGSTLDERKHIAVVRNSFGEFETVSFW